MKTFMSFKVKHLLKGDSTAGRTSGLEPPRELPQWWWWHAPEHDSQPQQSLSTHQKHLPRWNSSERTQLTRFKVHRGWANCWPPRGRSWRGQIREGCTAAGRM